ncbi:MAG: PseG/SpsG family protein [Candidatus Hermodarchaeota archaeon]
MDKIIICVDGYDVIGLGHIYRTISLANKLKDHNILFVSKKKHQLGIDLIRKHNLNLKVFETIREFWEIVSNFDPTTVINDILDTQVNYINSLKDKKIFVVNFEDLGEGSKYSDLTINALYEGSNAGNYYWGKDYYILREEFHNIGNNEIKKEVNNILITYGGTDPNNYSKKVLEAINDLNLKDLKINIILGLGYKQPELLKQSVKDYKLDLTIKQNVKNISTYMLQADIAFTSAGRTVYELASIGTPTIVLAQNEREMLHTFANEKNGIINLGLGYNCSDKKIKDVFLKVFNNFKYRKKVHNLMLKNKLKLGINNVINLIFKEYEKFRESISNEKF